MNGIKIGDRYKEYMVPFPGEFFSWEYEVVGFRTESYGDFAQCERIFSDGKREREKVGISIDLLTEEIFFKKVA